MAELTPSSRFDLPGFGLPVDFIPRGEGDCSLLFDNALDVADTWSGGVGLPLTTLREFTMLRFMNTITDKPDWHIKVNLVIDETITSKWKSEALSSGQDFSERMIDYCFSELRHKAKIFKETGAISIYNGDVVKSDVTIPISLREELKAAVGPLEAVPEKEKDWHPESDEKVLDLVHPSLYPLVYGQTRVLPDSLTSLEDCVNRCGEGNIITVPPGAETGDPALLRPDLYSTKFQWLPCEVDISDDETVKITSYINNLHPQKHQGLHAVLEKVIARVIPLWNMTLTPLKSPEETLSRIVYQECVYDPDPESGPETDGPQREPNETLNDFYERREEWIKATRQVVKPEPQEFEPFESLGPDHVVDLRRDYGERGLQVIVKLSNIHLTPEHPEYEGGTWHVEGQLNEHICASAIYYYDNENITSSSLAFRQLSNTDDADDVSYSQDHHDWLEDVFGCSNQESAVQDVGAVETREGRVLTWPNVLQHQVQPFKLEDLTKPGHRKILALFLVDPNIRIISTANVPCQQLEWWSEIIKEDSGAISALPVELQDAIFKEVDVFPIEVKQAKQLRLELMKERKNFVVARKNAFEEIQFSLCEH